MVKNYPELHKKHNLRLTIVEVCAFVNGVFNYNVLSKPMIDEFGIKTLIDNYINNVVTLYTMC
jgi:hypothetical protein